MSSPSRFKIVRELLTSQGQEAIASPKYGTYLLGNFEFGLISTKDIDSYSIFNFAEGVNTRKRFKSADIQVSKSTKIQNIFCLPNIKIPSKANKKARVNSVIATVSVDKNLYDIQNLEFIPALQKHTKNELRLYLNSNGRYHPGFCTRGWIVLELQSDDAAFYLNKKSVWHNKNKKRSRRQQQSHYIGLPYAVTIVHKSTKESLERSHLSMEAPAFIPKQFKYTMSMASEMFCCVVTKMTDLPGIDGVKCQQIEFLDRLGWTYAVPDSNRIVSLTKSLKTFAWAKPKGSKNSIINHTTQLLMLLDLEEECIKKSITTLDMFDVLLEFVELRENVLILKIKNINGLSENRPNVGYGSEVHLRIKHMSEDRIRNLHIQALVIHRDVVNCSILVCVKYAPKPKRDTRNTLSFWLHLNRIPRDHHKKYLRYFFESYRFHVRFCHSVLDFLFMYEAVERLKSSKMTDNRPLVSFVQPSYPKNGFDLNTYLFQTKNDILPALSIENTYEKNLQELCKLYDEQKRWMHPSLNMKQKRVIAIVSRIRMISQTNHKTVKFHGPLKSKNRNKRNKKMQKNGPIPPFVLIGPPGTGKTVVVTEAVIQSWYNGGTILVCAPSHSAADVICERLRPYATLHSSEQKMKPQNRRERNIQDLKGSSKTFKINMFRHNPPTRMVSSVRPAVLKFCAIVNQTFVLPNPQHLENFDVIVTTCAGSGFLKKSDFMLQNLTHIFIDEASQAMEPEIHIVLSHATRNTRVVIVGDPNQLGPVVRSLGAQDLACSVQEKLLSKDVYKKARIETPQGHFPIQDVLECNYRSHPALIKLSSDQFYGGNIKARANEEIVHSLEAWEPLQDTVAAEDLLGDDIVCEYQEGDANGRNMPFIFMGLQGEQRHDCDSPSYYNIAEAEKAITIVESLLRSKTVTVTAQDLGILAPYRKQVRKLRLMLRAKNLGAVKVGTVDDYQGQEEKIIIVTTVLSMFDDRKGQNIQSHNCVGFMNNPKRYNVAITRGKALAIFIGNPNVLCQDKYWRELLLFCVKNKTYRGCPCPSMGIFSHTNIGGQNFGTDNSDLAFIQEYARENLLGIGVIDQLYPTDLDHFYNSEMEWRVMI